MSSLFFNVGDFLDDFYLWGFKLNENFNETAKNQKLMMKIEFQEKILNQKWENKNVASFEFFRAWKLLWNCMSNC